MFCYGCRNREKCNDKDNTDHLNQNHDGQRNQAQEKQVGGDDTNPLKLAVFLVKAHSQEAFVEKNN